MPAGDGTGPLGRGPMTGRGMGYCGGYDAPGWANPGPGRALQARSSAVVAGGVVAAWVGWRRLGVAALVPCHRAAALGAPGTRPGVRSAVRAPVPGAGS